MKPNWHDLLQEALERPGVLAEGYSLFHNYSLGNQVLAAVQLKERGLPLSPIAPLSRWNKMGRRVKKREKALSLYLPISIREETEDGEEVKTVFILKPRWFSYHQTEGEEIRFDLTPPAWDKEVALKKLEILEVPFKELNGNAQGYALPACRKVAINPLAQHPWKALFHELAHVLLHDREDRHGEVIPRSLEEAEAEAVAYLCCATLNLPGLESARAYIQGWLSGPEKAEFLKKSPSRVFSAADRILKAGTQGEGQEGL